MEQLLLVTVVWCYTKVDVKVFFVLVAMVWITNWLLTPCFPLLQQCSAGNLRYSHIYNRWKTAVDLLDQVCDELVKSTWTSSEYNETNLLWFDLISSHNSCTDGKYCKNCLNMEYLHSTLTSSMNKCANQNNCHVRLFYSQRWSSFAVGVPHD